MFLGNTFVINCSWKQLLDFEQDEEEREFQARLTTVPLDRLEQQGLALKNMEVSTCDCRSNLDVCSYPV